MHFTPEVHPVIRHPGRPWAITTAALLLGAAAAAASPAPVRASDLPVRWTTGAAVWSTPQQAMDTFLSTGSISDRGLDGGLNRSGWSPEEIRAAMNKLYSVELAAVDRFLRSPAGEAVLKGQASIYYPYWSQGRTGLQALRAAILADAADGRISAATTMASLPTDMRLTPGCAAARGDCQPLLTWWVFLPARIQAGQISGPLAGVNRGRSATGAPAAAAVPDPAAR